MDNNFKFSLIKDALVKGYASDDDLRPNMCKANDYQDYWCVTDANIAVMIPHALIGEAGCSDLSYGPVVKNFVEIEDKSLFTLSELKLGLSNFYSYPDHDEVYQVCKTCGGEGELECDLGHDNECHNCNGKGEKLVSKTLNGHQYYPEKGEENECYDVVFKIGESIFHPQILNRVIIAIELMQLQDNIIQLTHSYPARASVFLVGGVQIVFMPTNTLAYKALAILPNKSNIKN